MKAKDDSTPQTQFSMPDLATMLDARQPLYRLAQMIDWKQFETAFGPLYAEEGRPGPARSAGWSDCCCSSSSTI